MNSKSQLKLNKQDFKNRNAFGGALLRKAKNRTARPVSSKHAMHVVLKTSRAVGRLSFGYKSNTAAVKKLIDKQCYRYGVKLIGYSNNFNHLHLHLKFPSRAVYFAFIRSMTGAIAMMITGARKLKASASGSFWDQRPFTRIVIGRRAGQILQDYIRLNLLEASGILPKRPGRLRDLKEDERWLFQDR